jgi:hypothetical protein
VMTTRGGTQGALLRDTGSPACASLSTAGRISRAGAVVVPVCLTIVVATAGPAKADNCSGLSDCSVGIKIALILAAILLLLLVGYYLAPFLAAQAGLALSRLALINALRAAGVKFAEAAIVGIARTAAGRLVWMEVGTAASGLAHIVARHGSQFAQWGFRTGPQIANFIMNTVRTGTPIATYPGGAVDYAVKVGNTIEVVRVVFGSNGYIVTAHPLGY